MKKHLFLSVFVLMFISCGGVKKTQQAVNEGNLEWAIEKSIEKITKNKDLKKNQHYIVLLEEAFEKHKYSELAKIEFWKKEGNPVNLESSYNALIHLNRLQERIAHLLPLQVDAELRVAFFEFAELDTQILETKNELVEYRYAQAQELLSTTQSKYGFRAAWEQLQQVEALQPDYLDTRELLDFTREMGTYNVLLTVQNLSDVMLPEILEAELLNVTSLSKRNSWARYHRYPNSDYQYDYEVILALNRIEISPDRLRENEKSYEKVINEGKKVVYNRKGEVVRDSLGNPVETEQLKRVKSNFNLITQTKSGMLAATIALQDINTGEVLGVRNLRGDAEFRHQFAIQRGDVRALEKWQRRLLKVGEAPFPNAFEMISLAGNEIQSDLERFLRQNRFE